LIDRWNRGKVEKFVAVSDQLGKPAKSLRMNFYIWENLSEAEACFSFMFCFMFWNLKSEEILLQFLNFSNLKQICFRFWIFESKALIELDIKIFFSKFFWSILTNIQWFENLWGGVPYSENYGREREKMIDRWNWWQRDEIFLRLWPCRATGEKLKCEFCISGENFLGG